MKENTGMAQDERGKEAGPERETEMRAEGH